jgi:hypothetical protein
VDADDGDGEDAAVVVSLESLLGQRETRMANRSADVSSSSASTSPAAVDIVAPAPAAITYWRDALLRDKGGNNSAALPPACMESGVELYRIKRGGEADAET